MKHQISISILLAILVIVLSLLYIKFSNDNKPDNNLKNEQLIEQQDKAPSITISQEYISYPFYIVEEDGKLVVYRTHSQERCMETGIGAFQLSQELQEQLKTGIFFQTEKELYDFLESYSS